MCHVGVHFYVRQPVNLRVPSYVRQHGLFCPSFVRRLAVSPLLRGSFQ